MAAAIPHAIAHGADVAAVAASGGTLANVVTNFLLALVPLLLLLLPVRMQDSEDVAAAAAA